MGAAAGSKAAIPPSSLRLDLANEFLWRGEHAILLRPKTFAVLRCLAERSGQLVTKAALCRAVWPDVAVDDGGLMVCIAELRRELGDDPKSPRFIQTLPRRGYRFLGNISVTPAPAEVRRTETRPSRRKATGVRAFGRAAELERLHGWLGQALGGSRQVVFLTGEAGVGKTTLVEAFIEEARSQADLLIARGQCIEHYGAGEAYLPFLEALGQLCRGEEGNELVALLAHRAPTWLVQMPWLIGASDLQALQRRVAGATRERMLREMAEALEALTAERPLLLVLEDLNWSDRSTRALIAWLARRREPARLLLLGTYRLAEVGTTEPHMHAFGQGLQLHGQCEELPLAFLSEEAVGEYLAARLTGGSIAPELPRLLHQRTDGNPLFMVNMVEYWLAQGWLAEGAGQWTLRAGPGELAAGVPENLRQMIERWLDRLDPEELLLLEVGSVAGIEFSAATVAAGLGEEVGRVEERCAGVARQGQLLRASGEERWPDRTVAGRYAFVHALYRDVLYGRVTPSARVRLHGRIAERQETAYGGRAGEIAAQLAMHFERGQNYRKAIAFLRLAAEGAVRRYASLEAIDHLSKALTLLETFPDGPERKRLELGLLTALGPALTTIKGYGANEVELTYVRARALCETLGESSQLFQVLRGLVTLQQHRGNLRTARQLAQDLLTLARNSRDRGLLLQAHRARGTTLFYLGEQEAARRDLEWCIAHHDLAQHGTRAGRSGVCTAVVCLGHEAWALWHLGYPDQALEKSRAALALGRSLGHPQTMACALYSAAALHHVRRDVQTTRECAESLVALAAEHGFTFWRMYGAALQGWAIAMQGDGDEGRSLLRKNLASLQATGAELPRTKFLGLLAEACLKARQTEAGLDAIAEALAAVETRGERFWEAELHRLQGALLWRGIRRQKPEERVRTLREAEKSLCRALDVARRQRAKSLELRAAMSLSALWQRRGKQEAAYRLLSQTYRWFTEGFDTPDLKAARAVLAKLSSSRGEA